MGPAHGCDLTDTWIGPIAKKHVDTCPVDHIDFSIYRDDSWDILRNGEADLQQYENHLDSLHPNLKWTTKYGKEGELLDLYLMIIDGRIETKVFTKSEPIYLHPSSCHDPSVFKAKLL